MPLERCVRNGSHGFQYGGSTCFIGPDAFKQAAKLAIAELGPEKFIAELKVANMLDNRATATIESILDEVVEYGPVVLVNPSDTEEAVRAYISKKRRDEISEQDFGWPEERKYPVTNQEELDAAAKLIGRAPAAKQAAIKERIKKIAARKNLVVPKAWS